MPVALYFGGHVAASGLVRIGLGWTSPSFVISTEEPAAAIAFQLNLIVVAALILLWRARSRTATGPDHL